MRTHLGTIALVFAVALAAAGGGYALGTQSGSGTASAARPRAQHGPGARARAALVARIGRLEARRRQIDARIQRLTARLHGAPGRPPGAGRGAFAARCRPGFRGPFAARRQPRLARLAQRIGVDPAKLRDALQQVRAQRIAAQRKALAGDLARILNVPEPRVENALPSGPPRPRCGP
jgi:hypothetical protein